VVVVMRHIERESWGKMKEMNEYKKNIDLSSIYSIG